MNTFVEAVKQNFNNAVTENGMPAFSGTYDACLDLFYSIGASRGKDILPAFAKAHAENPVLAFRILLWSRDVRGGAGERAHFRNVLSWATSVATPEMAHMVICSLLRTPEIGRWDDVFYVYENVADGSVFASVIEEMCRIALAENDGLWSKWMPRKGPVAARLRKALGMSPKTYRKTLVALTNVVEQKMCANDWNSIEFGKVPSVASLRYRKAFARHSPVLYTQYLEGLKKGTEKVNASAVYPYQVVDAVRNTPELAEAMWAALPNYTNGRNILPVVDVSGSMTGGSPAPLDVSVSLGLYCAMKNSGPFHGIFCTFSESPVLLSIEGLNLCDVLETVERSSWGMNTNLEAVFTEILERARLNNVKQEDMPETILIMSDMQFDQCVQNGNDNAMQMVERMYAEAGYTVPGVVFWNLRHAGNFPAISSKKGVAMVSGFSPAILKSILSGTNFTPQKIMLETVNVERYDPTKIV